MPSNAVCAAGAGFIFPPGSFRGFGVHLSDGQTPPRRWIGRAGTAQFAARAGSPPPPPDSAAERELVARLTRAYDTGDVDGIVALLTDDVLLTMPPVPLEYQGRELTARFLTVVAFREGRTYRLIATRANGQPAFGSYVRDPHTGLARAMGLQVLTLAGNQICGITRFDNSVLPRFGLPRTLPE